MVRWRMFTLLALSSPVALAQVSDVRDEGVSNLHLQLYGTLSTYRAEAGPARWRPDSRVPNSSGVGQWRWDGDSRIGAQLRWQIRPELEWVTQVLAKDDLSRRWAPAIEWAYLSWRPADAWNVRLGRQTLPVQLMSENKHIGLAHTTVRPPATVYQLNNGVPVDGINISWSRPLGGGELSLDSGLGHAATQLATARIDIHRNASLVAAWQSEQWLVRLGFNAYRLDLDNPGLPRLLDAEGCLNCVATFASRAPTANIRGRLLTASASWSDQGWTLSGEWSRRSSSSVMTPAASGWYLMASRRWGQIVPFGWVGETRFREAPLGLQASPGSPAAVVQRLALLDRYLQSPFDRRIVSLGLRYDLTERMSLKLQAEWWRATRDLQTGRTGDISLAAPPIAAPLAQAWDGRVQVQSLSLDFIF